MSSTFEELSPSKNQEAGSHNILATSGQFSGEVKWQLGDHMIHFPMGDMVDSERGAALEWCWTAADVDLHDAGQTVPRAAATPCRGTSLSPAWPSALEEAAGHRAASYSLPAFTLLKSPCLIPGHWLYDYVWEEVKKKVRMLLVVRLSTYLYQQIFSNVKMGHQRQSKRTPSVSRAGEAFSLLTHTCSWNTGLPFKRNSVYNLKDSVSWASAVWP